MPFGEIPVQVDISWVLRGIDDSSGQRIAEFDMTLEGSGAVTLNIGGGDVMVSTLQESAFTIFFNLDTRLPVSTLGYSVSEMQFEIGAENHSFATNSELEAASEAN